jgi:hypothetical protein
MDGSPGDNLLLLNLKLFSVMAGLWNDPIVLLKGILTSLGETLR